MPQSLVVTFISVRNRANNVCTDFFCGEIIGKLSNIGFTLSDFPIGNGGSTSRYVWTQTLEEVTVHVPLLAGIRAKDLDEAIEIENGSNYGNAAAVLLNDIGFTGFIKIPVNGPCHIKGCGMNSPFSLE